MRTCRFLAILTLLVSAAFAGAVYPAWTRLYSGVTQSQNNAAADSYLDTLTGNLYVVGSGELPADPGGTDLLVAKYRPDGTLAWVNGFSGSDSGPDDMAQSVAVDSVGNVYIAGMVDNVPESDDAAWAKYDSNGVEIWHRTSMWGGDDAAYGIVIGNAGDVYICGADSGYGYLSGYMVARIDPVDGDTLWRRSYVLDTEALTPRNPGRDLYPGYFDEYFFWDNAAASIAASPDGGVVTTGHGSDFDRCLEWWTMKFDAAGNRLWAVTYRNPNTVYDEDDVAFDVAVAQSGDIYAVGFDYYESGSNSQGYNFAVVRYSSAGSRLNWRSIDVGAEHGDDHAFSVALDDSTPQNVYVTGTLAYPWPLDEQISTMKFSSTLTSRWGAAGATYGNVGDDLGYSVFYRKDRVYVTGQNADDLIALGYTAANTTSKDTLWSYRYDGSDHAIDFGATICASDSDHVFISGEVTHPDTLDSWASLYTVRLRYGHPDMAVTSILAPQGQYDHYDTVIPRAVVRNYGDVTSKSSAFMYIGLPYGDTVQITDAPEPGDSVVVAFKPWPAHPTGLVPVRCSLETDGDINPANDFLIDTVRVGPLDVGCRLILSPAGLVDSGTFVMPVARYKNYGVSPHTFPVWFEIDAPTTMAAERPGGTVKNGALGSRTSPTISRPPAGPTTGPLVVVYDDSATITLGAQESMDVSFDLWQAYPVDTYQLRAFTALTLDDNRANDTARAPLIVRHPLHDVGVSAILAPPDTLDTGAVVVPRAVIRNFGGVQESFRIRFTVGTFFTSETAMTLPAGASDTAEFAPWTANQIGTHTARCTTMLAADTFPLNDFRQKQVIVLPMQGIESPENLSGIPREYALGSPRPNPFTGRMLVRYALPIRSRVSLRIYNAGGVLIRTLTAAELPAGFHSTLWNGTDDRGQRVQPGTYFCRFQTPGFTRIAKLIMTD